MEDKMREHIDVKTKNEIVEIAERFMREAYDATCYYAIVQQFDTNRESYLDELNCSPAYHSIVFNALVVATLMELAKIYDSHKKSISIRKLMDIAKENVSLFPKDRQVVFEVDGTEKREIFPYQMRVDEKHDEFFANEVKSHKAFAQLLELSDSRPVVDMTIERFFDLYEWEYHRIDGAINNLRQQRNKVYAHNDENSLLDLDNKQSCFPLSHADVSSLIDFATEFSRFVVAMLTGVYKANKPVNIGDWGNTLQLAHLGMKYRETEIKAALSELGTTENDDNHSREGL
jgi:hypothetical protein